MKYDRKNITYIPIGVIYSEHTIAEETQIQQACAKGCRGRAEILPEYEEGLRDLDDFSHIDLMTISICLQL